MDNELHAIEIEKVRGHDLHHTSIRHADGSQYTAIYTDSWMCGSHIQTLTQMRRIEQNEGETVTDMLERNGIAVRTVFLFHGHSPLHGE